MVGSDGKTAFVFTGGGSLGAIQVGMLRALHAAQVHPDLVVGASVGAINAGYFACFPTAEGVANLGTIWTALRRSDIFPLTLANIIGLLRHPGYLVDPSGLRRVIETNLPCAELQETKIPLVVMATDLQGNGVGLSTGSAVDAILASAAIPGVFPPAEIGGKPLMDGAVAANTPVRLAAHRE
jgi:NTE family protein